MGDHGDGPVEREQSVDINFHGCALMLVLWHNRVVGVGREQWGAGMWNLRSC
jgi:hypothetical protein